MSVMASKFIGKSTVCQQLVQAHNKGNIKTLHHWPIVKGIHQRPVDSPHKGPVTSSCIRTRLPPPFKWFWPFPPDIFVYRVSVNCWILVSGSVAKAMMADNIQIYIYIYLYIYYMHIYKSGRSFTLEVVVLCAISCYIVPRYIESIKCVYMDSFSSYMLYVKQHLIVTNNAWLNNAFHLYSNKFKLVCFLE